MMPDPRNGTIAELMAAYTAECTTPLLEQFASNRPDASDLDRAAARALVNETTMNVLILALLGVRRCEVVKRPDGQGRWVHNTYEFRFLDGGVDIAGRALPKAPDEPFFGSGGTYL